jgi:hypothetical protein
VAKQILEGIILSSSLVRKNHLVYGKHMTNSNGNQINLLIGGFMDLLEEWEKAPHSFVWEKLQALAQAGAHAYNEGAGPSFHMLALDGVPHGEFHERFLNDSLKAGFDPFKLAKTGNGKTMTPVLSHSSLAEAARGNPASARMQAANWTRHEPYHQRQLASYHRGCCRIHSIGCADAYCA